MKCWMSEAKYWSSRAVLDQLARSMGYMEIGQQETCDMRFECK